MKAGVRPAPSLDHLAVLSDDTGIIQHAIETIPNRSTGYCTDDIARGWMVAVLRLRLDPADALAARLACTYLAFLHDAQMDDGRFHNFMSFQRDWLDEVGTQDSNGRALWALGFGMRYAGTDPWRRVCGRLFERGLGALDDLVHVRSRAYAMLGLHHACEAPRGRRYAPALRRLAGALHDAYRANRREDWEWFEPAMTYDNARLPEALIRAGSSLRDPEMVECGLTTLGFYDRVVTIDDTFVPIGNDGWYERGGKRAIYAQQPLEATAQIDAHLAALDATGDALHLERAQTALAWFYGKNTNGETMTHEGGCYDGLERGGVNRNMGAESTLALLAGAYAMAEREGRVRYRPAAKARRIS